MRKTVLNLAMLSTLAVFTTVVRADVAAARGVFTLVETPSSLTFTFSGLSLGGFEFSQLVGPSAGFSFGTLTAVSVNATLDASVDFTYADDLTIYVDPAPLHSGGLLQIGGFTSLGANEKHFWANGGSSAPGTTVIDTVVLTTPITFNGSAANPVIWLGNGYGVSTANGTWTGSVSLTGLSVTPVPEPASLALFGAGAAGLVGWMGRRRRQAAAAR